MSELTEILEEVPLLSDDTSENIQNIETSTDPVFGQEEVHEISEKLDTENISEKWKKFFRRTIPVYDVTCLWRQQFFVEHR